MWLLPDSWLSKTRAGEWAQAATGPGPKGLVPAPCSARRWRSTREVPGMFVGPGHCRSLSRITAPRPGVVQTVPCCSLPTPEQGPGAGLTPLVARAGSRRPTRCGWVAGGMCSWPLSWAWPQAPAPWGHEHVPHAPAPSWALPHPCSERVQGALVLGCASGARVLPAFLRLAGACVHVWCACMCTRLWSAEQG